MPQLLQIFSTLTFPEDVGIQDLELKKNLPPLVTKWTSNPQGFQGKNCMQKFYANHLPEEKGLSWCKITDFYPNLATVHNVGVDGEVRIDQAHLVFKLLGHALSGFGSHRGWNWIFWSQFQVFATPRNQFSDVCWSQREHFTWNAWNLWPFCHFKFKFGPLHHVFTQENKWNSLKPLNWNVIPLSEHFWFHLEQVGNVAANLVWNSIPRPWAGVMEWHWIWHHITY